MAAANDHDPEYTRNDLGRMRDQRSTTSRQIAQIRQIAEAASGAVTPRYASCPQVSSQPALPSYAVLRLRRARYARRGRTPALGLSLEGPRRASAPRLSMPQIRPVAHPRPNGGLLWRSPRSERYRRCRTAEKYSNANGPERPLRTSINALPAPTFTDRACTSSHRGISR